MLKPSIIRWILGWTGAFQTTNCGLAMVTYHKHFGGNIKSSDKSIAWAWREGRCNKEETAQLPQITMTGAFYNVYTISPR